jgi:uncharacterized integral membrane protein (TIGR00698 family)
MVKPSRFELLAKEDYWAIWIGFFVFIVCMIIFFTSPPPNMEKKFSESNDIIEKEKELPFKSIEWYNAVEDKQKITGSSQEHGKFLKKLFSSPHKWSSNPIDAFYLSDEAAKERNREAQQKYEDLKSKEIVALSNAKIAEEAARNADFRNNDLNEKAETSILIWRDVKREASAAKKKIMTSGYNYLVYMIPMSLIVGLIFSFGAHFLGFGFIRFFKGYFAVFTLALVAYVLGAQTTLAEFGLGFPLWAIFLGIIIANTVTIPEWIKPALQTEYFIKTGLVLLGFEILFEKILLIGIPGIFVTWIVTPIVIVSTFWLGQRILKIASKELNIVICSDMSVCGVSAAIATAAACKAKKEELTLAVGMSLTFTAIMMVVLPIVIKATGMPDVLGGAWIGGTIDSSGAVVAAGALLGERGMFVAATIKMIQNMMIGVISFFVAMWWTMKYNVTDQVNETGKKVSWAEIWYRFPKFILGFVAASIIVSLISSYLGPDACYALIEKGVTGAMTKDMREWLFCLAFASIGLSTDFRQLKKHLKGGKPLILYVCGQSFNLLLTLTMAYLMFYVFFRSITDSL